MAVDLGDGGGEVLVVDEPDVVAEVPAVHGAPGELSAAPRTSRICHTAMTVPAAVSTRPIRAIQRSPLSQTVIPANALTRGDSMAGTSLMPDTRKLILHDCTRPT